MFYCGAITALSNEIAQQKATAELQASITKLAIKLGAVFTTLELSSYSLRPNLNAIEALKKNLRINAQ
jgi:hypothetical protein